MATLLSDRLALDIPRLALLSLRAFGCFSRAARASALSVAGARFAVAVCLATGTMLHCMDTPCNSSHLYAVSVIPENCWFPTTLGATTFSCSVPHSWQMKPSGYVVSVAKACCGPVRDRGARGTLSSPRVASNNAEVERREILDATVPTWPPAVRSPKPL